MAVTVDSAELLIKTISKDLNSINDKLAVVGSYFILKTAIEYGWHSIYVFKAFVVPNLGFQFVKRPRVTVADRPWALICNGLTDVSQGFAEGFASRGFNIAIITPDRKAIKELINELETKYEIQTQVLAPTPNVMGPDAIDSLRSQLIQVMKQKQISYWVNNKYQAPKQLHLQGHNKFYELFNYETGAIIEAALALDQNTNWTIFDIGLISNDLKMNVLIANGVPDLKIILSQLATIIPKDKFVYDVMTVNPMFSMRDSGTSGLIRRLIQPNSRQFAASVISKYGWTKQTTGYWSHGLVYFIYNLLPKKTFIPKKKPNWTKKILMTFLEQTILLAFSD